MQCIPLLYIGDDARCGNKGRIRFVSVISTSRHPIGQPADKNYPTWKLSCYCLGSDNTEEGIAIEHLTMLPLYDSTCLFNIFSKCDIFIGSCGRIEAYTLGVRIRLHRQPCKDIACRIDNMMCIRNVNSAKPGYLGNALWGLCDNITIF